jgi:hypothetical protein
MHHKLQEKTNEKILALPHRFRRSAAATAAKHVITAASPAAIGR